MKIKLSESQSLDFDTRWIENHPDFDPGTHVFMCGSRQLAYIIHDNREMQGHETLNIENLMI